MSGSSPLIDAPLAPTMFKLAVPGVVGALLTSLPGLIEANFLKESGAQASPTASPRLLARIRKHQLCYLGR